MNETPTH